MGDSNPERERIEIAAAMRRHMIARYVKDCVVASLEEMITPEIRDEEIRIRVSDDHLIFTIFSYIDLLGYLYKGENSSVNAVDFMREYLGRVDGRYREVSGLLYHAFRHGYVHLATPKRIKLRDRKILDFTFARSGEREKYLQIRKISEVDRITGKTIDIYRLCIDLPLLYRDLLSAIDIYISDIENVQNLSDTCQQAFETRREPEKAKEEDLINKPYISQSDFDFIRTRIN